MANPIKISQRSAQESDNLDTDSKTPPGRYINLPLTPPASSERCQTRRSVHVENALQVFQGLQNRIAPGPHNDEEITLNLPRDQYSHLIEALKSDQALDNYAKCKARWEYDPDASVVLFRMPTPVHDFFAVAVANEICRHLRLIENTKNAAGKFASRIASGGSSRIILKEGGSEDEKLLVYPQRQPDAQFQHPEAVYPGVVVEISYAQKGRDLNKIAWDYITNSNGDIKVVIGIDIKYGDTKESTLSLWRPSYIQEEGEELDILEVNQEINNQPFRVQDGSFVNQEETLCFKLSEFAPDELSAGFQDTEICIKYKTLAELLNDAEKMNQARESGPGIKSKRKTRKRKLSSSSADEIKTDDESKHSLREKEDEALSTAHDVDYIPKKTRV